MVLWIFSLFSLYNTWFGSYLEIVAVFYFGWCSFIIANVPQGNSIPSVISKQTFISALLYHTLCYYANFRIIPHEILRTFLNKLSNWITINTTIIYILTCHLWTFAFLESISMAAFAWSSALYVRDCLPFGLPLPPSIWAMNVDAFASRHNKSAFLAFCNGAGWWNKFCTATSGGLDA